MRRIDPIDAVVYILAQLSGAVLGALLVKGLLLDEGRASDYGNAEVSALLGGNFAGAVVEALGTFLLVTRGPRRGDEPARPPGVGAAGDRHHARLRGDDLRPADRRVVQPGPLVRPGADRQLDRWQRPARYVLGPLVGAVVAFAVYRFVIAGPQYAEGAEPPTSDVRGVAQAVKDAEVRGSATGSGASAALAL